MKIGILTFQNTLNYGAMLQAYALQKVLYEMGNEVEILNYRNPTITYRETPKIPPAKEFIEHPRGSLRFLRTYNASKKRAEEFENFTKRHLCLSGYITNQEDVVGKYDVIVVGSDQVWNLACTGNDFFYFLENLDRSKIKTISYAASFGSDTFPSNYFERCASAIKKFYAVSVREISGLALVKSMTGCKASLTLDPTLLLKKNDWEQITAPSFDSAPFVFAYVVSERKETVKFAKEVARKQRANLIITDCYNGATLLDKQLYYNSLSPEEFLSLLSNAAYVVTSSFHGLALSLAMEKEVYYSLNTKAANRNSRLETLATLAGIKDRTIDEGFADNPINYELVTARLLAERNSSLQFLKDSLYN